MATWLHYVGGKYTPTRFIHEANKYGFARRIPFHMLQSIHWGDTVAFAIWKGSADVHIVGEEKNTFKAGKAEIFAYGTISRISIEDPEIQKIVHTTLVQKGKVISVSSSSQLVLRACGFYYSSGSITTSATVQEIYEIAKEAAQKLNRNPSPMIMGQITTVLSPPQTITAPFTRSLILMPTPSEITVDVQGEQTSTGTVVHVHSHTVAKKKDDFAIPLLPLTKHG